MHSCNVCTSPMRNFPSFSMFTHFSTSTTHQYSYIVCNSYVLLLMTSFCYIIPDLLAPLFQFPYNNNPTSQWSVESRHVSTSTPHILLPLTMLFHCNTDTLQWPHTQCTEPSLVTSSWLNFNVQTHRYFNSCGKIICVSCSLLLC
jgi:hypothetical protein